jgi:hypothetical protein
MAGRVSGSVDAKILILNHISSKSDSKGDRNNFQLRLIQDAKEASEGKSDVLVSYDFMEVLVPWMGFGERLDEEPSSSPAEDIDPRKDGDTASASTSVKSWFGMS